MKKEIVVYPNNLSGTIHIQPSKSFAHRALICASMAEGESVIRNVQLSEDIQATVRALTAMGFAKFDLSKKEVVRVFGGLRNRGTDIIPEVDCGESGSTLRFLIPLALLEDKEFAFTGKGRLMVRPLTPYEDICKKIGAKWELKGDKLNIKGKLVADKYELAGNISSQFISGLLFSLPMLNKESKIVITTELESKAYVELTLAVMKAFGVKAGLKDNVISIDGNQSYKPADYEVEADYSHAAFYLVAGAIGGGITCTGLKEDSEQSDKAIIDILQAAGAHIEYSEKGITIKRSKLKAFNCDISQCPDLAPVLAVLACACEGTSRLENGARLRYKESDRLSAMAVELSNLGASVEEGGDYLVIKGTGRLKGGNCNVHGDHRVAMALAVASNICEEPIVLNDFTVVSKSAPNFWSEFEQVGGICYVSSVGE